MSNWTQVYATDAAGAVVSGSLATLQNAVLRGADVKVLYMPSAGIWWSRYCESVKSHGTGASALVSAVFMNAGDTLEVGDGLAFNEPFSIEYHIYSSNGMRKLYKIQQNNQAVLIANESRILPIRWYVKDYTPLLLPWPGPWLPWLS